MPHGQPQSAFPLVEWLVAPGLVAYEAATAVMAELERRSLGTYTILWLIERARLLGLPHVYLGYWVRESRQMAYKSRFRPSEILVGGRWMELGNSIQSSTLDDKSYDTVSVHK